MLTVALAFGAMGWTLSSVHAADAAASAWGQRRSVVVARADLEPGRAITTDDIDVVARPIAVVPDDAADSPLGRTVTHSIARGEVVTERRMAGNGSSGPTAQLGDSSVAFAIPSDAATPSLKIGDHVTLFAPSDVVATAGRSAGPATRIADYAVVVSVSEKAVMIGVPLGDAASVAKALLATSVVIALTE